MDITKLNKLKQGAPEIPTNTCPYIDFIQEIIKEVIDECDSSFIEQKLELAISTLEYVRESNDALRQSSKYWYNKIK
jgi:hypothetical protein